MRHIMAWLLLVTCGLLLAPAAGARVPEIPRLRHIDVAAGLPSSTVKSLKFDADGFLWLATTDGLARYDGVGMQVWRHDPTDPTSLSANFVTLVHVDPQGRIWVAPEGHGLSVLDSAHEQFRHFRVATHPEIGSDDIWALVSHKGALWMGGYGGGVSRMGADGAISRFTASDENPRSLPSDIILSLAVDGQGTLWAGSTKGLARWTGRDFERVALPGAQPTPMIYSLAAFDGRLWVGTSVGVFRLAADGGWDQPEWSAMFEQPNAVLSMLPGEDGELWISSQRQLWRVADGQVPVPVPVGAKGPAIAIGEMVKQDTGAIWIPVPGVGLGYLPVDWRRIAQFSRDHDGLSADLYSAIAPAREGGVWLGGMRAELERLDRDGNVIPVKPAIFEALEGMSSYALREDAAGRLWVGQRRQLVRIDLRGGIARWGQDGSRDATLPGPLTLMELAPDGTLWMSFAGAGVQQREPASGRVLRTVPPGPEHGLGMGDHHAMAFDAGGAPWFGGADGVLRWSAEAGRFEPVPGIVGEGRVFALGFDGADDVWLQRLSGLEHYRRAGDGWTQVATIGAPQGIPAVEGAGLQIDRLGRVWLSTPRGLYRWDPEAGKSRHFGLFDGLRSQEFVNRTLMQTHDGVMVSAQADGGVVMVDSLAADPAPIRSPLHWDRVEVRRDGRWLPMDLLGPLALAPGDREMRVQLRLLAYDKPKANAYVTMLEGYDHAWVDHGAEGERIFAGLAPGKYTLRARAHDAVGNEAAEQVLHFDVLPPWWQTGAARLALVCLLLLMGWWTVLESRRRIERRQAWKRAEHEREVAHEASLAKTRFLATLGHEVRTPMTGVLGMSELLLETALDARQRSYATSIHRAGEHLLRLVNDALDLARIESGKLELAAEVFDLHALMDELAEMSAPLVEARGLAFVVDRDPATPRLVRGDAVRVRQILLNLLGNAAKFTERGSIRLAVAPADAGGVVLCVSDTGPGLNAEQVSRLFRRFEQADGLRTAARYGGSGLGLAICQELAAAMGGTIEVTSAPGEGASFAVRLPLEIVADQPPHSRVIAPREPLPALADSSLPTSSPGKTAPSSADLDPAGKAGLSLLLVEDDPIVADVIIGLLHGQGHAVVHAGHGLAALAESSMTRFDAALLDLDLPGLDGLSLARQLRAQGFTRPLIAVTARADTDAEPHALVAGFDRFLRKPVTGAMLREALAAAR
ncbi:response regulator [Lysobacter sp. H21R4]|uniref:hybrid sensor histidine kinase/response regulator n=1 Tax=Lysobacter sp. H21R4 TaxID=2781021 RepID=UPI001888C15D|nr:hybrid sensor histidine kinase/response regulator [Lysobacter sp. H21R4]QOY62240.1 response regulator [Lysobacter sp. H21R4]